MLEEFCELSKKYNVSLENVLSIALNRYGIVIEDFPDNRIRFDLQLLDSDKKNFFAVCVNTYPSPFKLKDNKLYLEDSIVGTISKIEKDTCTSTYFRNNNKCITFNSNSRSKCVGCKFCGTYSLDEDDGYDFSKKENIIRYFDNLLKTNNIEGMEKIENVTICTGCFKNEDDLVNHLLLIKSAFNNMNYNGSINYIGSQLRDYDKLKVLKDELGDFGLYLTIEKFLDREKFMRPEKASLTLEKAKDLLAYSKSLGITSTFLYILGLEPLDVVTKYFNYFKDSINKYPIVQVFQDYTKEQEQYRCMEAKNIEYYLKARKEIEGILANSSLNPKLWECYRSLYYEEPEKGVYSRCRKKN